MGKIACSWIFGKAPQLNSKEGTGRIDLDRGPVYTSEDIGLVMAKVDWRWIVGLKGRSCLRSQLRHSLLMRIERLQFREVTNRAHRVLNSRVLREEHQNTTCSEARTGPQRAEMSLADSTSGELSQRC